MALAKFAVIGHPVAHSLSPRMHAANFAAIGFDGSYGKFDIEPDRLIEAVRSFGREGYLGLNVTVPHKEAVIAALDHIDESVRRYGACNTVKFEKDGSISGWNTDVDGFLSCLGARGFSLKGAKVFIIGLGGAGSALAAACCIEGASSLALAARSAGRAAGLAERLSSIAKGTALKALSPAVEGGGHIAGWCEAAFDADIVVNATPLGLKPADQSALPKAAFRKGQFVLDIIPTASFPPTAALARSAGAEAVDGLEFLVGQGAKSFEIWTGVKADRKAMLESLRPEGIK